LRLFVLRFLKTKCFYPDFKAALLQLYWGFFHLWFSSKKCVIATLLQLYCSFVAAYWGLSALRFSSTKCFYRDFIAA
jgi:hypothetical protein